MTRIIDSDSGNLNSLKKDMTLINQNVVYIGYMIAEILSINGLKKIKYDKDFIINGICPHCR